MYMYNYFLHQIKERFVTIMVRFSTQGAYFVTLREGAYLTQGPYFFCRETT